ncbi:MAG: Do family serine endopeptidase [Bacteroidota bacterium]
MKKYATLITSAVIGSLLTVGLLYMVGVFPGKTLRIEHVNDSVARGVLYTENAEGEMVPLDFTTISERVTDAVVNIRSTETVDMTQRQQQQIPDPFREFFGDEFFRHFGPQQGPQNQEPRIRMGTGSGVIIDSEGHIITNNHVIAKADDIEVTLTDNRTFKAKIIGTDPSTDLALIRINASDLPSLPLVNSDDVRIGEWVLAVGNPFDLTSTVTAGIVSAKARSINILPGQHAIESFIQTDAAINPGNSGGALVNLQGGVIGINTAIASPTGAYSGYGFAVPSNIVKKVVEDLFEYGTVQRGYLGVTIRNLDGNLASELDINITKGVYIDSVLAESAADMAGIKSGDVVIAVNDQPVKAASELQELIARNRPGDEVTVTIHRNGKVKDYKVELHNRQGTTEKVNPALGKLESAIGARFETIDKKLADKLNVEGGVKITDLRTGELSRQTKIREGFIITGINNKSVTTVDELLQELKDRKGGVMLEGYYEGDSEKRYYAFGM